MTIVNQTAKTLDEGIKNLMAGAKADYVKWSTLGGKELTGYSKEQVDNWDNKTKYAVFLYDFNIFFSLRNFSITIPFLNLFFTIAS